MLRTVTVRPDRVTGSEEVVVVPLHARTRTLGPSASALDRLCRSAVSDHLKARRFSGETGETALIALRASKAPAHVLLVGLGSRDKSTPRRVTLAGGAAAKALGRSRFKSASVIVDDVAGEDAAAFTHAFVKGFDLALYAFSLAADGATANTLRRLTVLSGDRAAASASVARTRVVAEHTAILRDLVNTPANLLTPADLAAKARTLCKEHGVSCKVIGRTVIEKEGMGGILNVGRGSVHEPKLVVMQYNAGRDGLPTVCLVGKGVTFDSGGISIKPWSGMHEMKGDMAGGGLVISTIAAAARLELPVRIVGIVPCVENMVDGSSFRPGDVVKTYSGKTVEVLTTDAEGRLILADALTYAREHFDPDVTVDFATLTGAVVIALGTRIAGVMGNSQEYIDALVGAGRRSGEAVWQLPLDDDFYDEVKGDISDYKNYTGRNGSTITAAALLGKFVGDDPWVHVDIAGTFWSEGNGGSYQTKGATGFGVDLTLSFLESLANRG
jgi:leucyl aminopeptidase